MRGGAKRGRSGGDAAATTRRTRSTALLNPPDSSDKKMKTVETVPADGKKVSFCRCWQSGSHPFCDGSHNKFNKETGDNVGPLVVGVSKE